MRSHKGLSPEGYDQTPQRGLKGRCWLIMDKEENIQEHSTRNLTLLGKWEFCLEREGADPALQEAVDEGLEKQQGQDQEC